MRAFRIGRTSCAWDKSWVDWVKHRAFFSCTTRNKLVPCMEPNKGVSSNHLDLKALFDFVQKIQQGQWMRMMVDQQHNVNISGHGVVIELLYACGAIRWCIALHIAIRMILDDVIVLVEQAFLTNRMHITVTHMCLLERVRVWCINKSSTQKITKIHL